MEGKFSLQDAVKAHLDGDMKRAERMYRAILEKHPTAFEPFFYMASLLAQQGKNPDAVTFLHRAAQLSDNPTIYNNLGSLYRKMNHPDLAAEALRKGLDVEDNPIRDDLLNNLGTTCVNEGDPDEGEKYLRQALEVNPKHPQANWNLGLVLLEKGVWQEGWEKYHWGTFGEERRARWVSWPQWSGQKAKVVIYGEQGLGDEIMFASILPDVIEDIGAANIILECHPRLETTFKRTFKGIHIQPTRKLEVTQIPDFNYRCAIGDLGMFYRNSAADFPKKPYLKMDDVYLCETKQGYERFPRPWIGVGWRGGYTKTRKDLRSLPLEEWLPVFKSSKGTFFSFQYQDTADAEVDEFCKAHPEINLKHFPAIARATDYDIILHHLYCMDLVIHVNGTGVHACGALGTPCYTLTPSKPAWRYGVEGNEMPFYGENVQQIRQKGDDWEMTLRMVSGKVRGNHFPRRLS